MRPKTARLAVDDNAINRAVVATLLEPLGVSVTTASSGLEAVAAWERQTWDAILMDIHMPEMDGLSATAEIRRHEARSNRPRTPIIAVTASALAHEQDAYLRAGLDDCVPKPIELPRLIAALQQFVGAEADDEAPPSRAVGA